jgi:hypothetical protein
MCCNGLSGKSLCHNKGSLSVTYPADIAMSFLAVLKAQVAAVMGYFSCYFYQAWVDKLATF